jgi:hypothetical protein
MTSKGGFFMRATRKVIPLVVPFALACGGSDPAPQTAASASTTAAPSAAPADKLATILTTDPAQLEAIAKSASSAPALTGGATKDLQDGLSSVAAKVAPDLAADGDAVSATLKEGDHVEWTVSLKPGKCYAIVGFSPSGKVADLDLHLLAPPLYSSMTGEDVTDDNTPAIGAAPNAMCPVADPGMPYKLDVTAQKGAGPVAVRLYSKSK